MVSFRVMQNENEQLHDQLRELRDENGRLYKLLSEKDFEIKHLKKKREEDRLALAGNRYLKVMVEWLIHKCVMSIGKTFIFNLLKVPLVWQERLQQPKLWNCQKRIVN